MQRNSPINTVRNHHAITIAPTMYKVTFILGTGKRCRRNKMMEALMTSMAVSKMKMKENSVYSGVSTY